MIVLIKTLHNLTARKTASSPSAVLFSSFSKVVSWMMIYLGQLHKLRLGHLPIRALSYKALVVGHDAVLILPCFGHQDWNLRIRRRNNQLLFFKEILTISSTSFWFMAPFFLVFLGFLLTFAVLTLLLFFLLAVSDIAGCLPVRWWLSGLGIMKCYHWALWEARAQ